MYRLTLIIIDKIFNKMRLLRVACQRISHYQSKPVKIIHTQGNDIHFNLAIQQFLFQTAKVQMPTLFLWRNSPTIVIGKHQNPWKQCKVEEMKKDNVKLSRRKTGGGAVYQDLGNTCFSFLTPYSPQDKLQYRSINNQIILDALGKLGAKAQVSGRNDLVVDGKKFSGSAYRLHLGGKDGRGKKSLHHGTIMFSVDFNALQKYLNPNKKKLQSKGIDSVISRVVNLHQLYPSINHQNFCKQIQKSFENYYTQGKHQTQRISLNIENLKDEEYKIISKNYERLKSWDWLYGQCPYFKYTIQKKFEWGLVQITFQVQNGKIAKCKIYSDCLIPDFISAINQRMIGVSYDNQGLSNLQNSLKNQYKENQNLVKMSSDICQWVRSQI